MRKNNKKSSRARPKRTNGAQRLKTNHSAVTHRTLITSDETDVSLRFRSINNVSGAGPFFSKAFVPNAAYDVDPALGSTETLGFDEYAALYTYYRVISYSYVLQVTSNSATSDPVTVYVLNTNIAVTGSRYDLYSTNPYCQTKVLTPYGVHDNIVFRGKHSVSQILGSRVPETDDNYRALTTGVPSDLVFLTLGFESLASSNVAFQYILDIWMDVRFYGREIDLTLSAMALRINEKLQKRAQYNLLKQNKGIVDAIKNSSKQ